MQLDYTGSVDNNIFQAYRHILHFDTRYAGISERFAWDHASIPYDDPVWWDRLNQHRSGRNTALRTEEEKLMVGYAGQMEDYLR